MNWCPNIRAAIVFFVCCVSFFKQKICWSLRSCPRWKLPVSDLHLWNIILGYTCRSFLKSTVQTHLTLVMLSYLVHVLRWILRIRQHKILWKKPLLSWIKGLSFQHVFDIKLKILIFMLHISHYINAKLCAVLKSESV